MAGEWIAYDLGLPDKPEVQELIDETGRPVAEVVFSLLRLWGWAAMNTVDGRARMTVPRLVRTCGQDEAFWQAVAAVGWLEIDETGATVAIPRWDRRFSQAAKARLQHADRAAASEDRRRRAGAPCAQAQDAPAPTRRRGEERREEVPPPPREASQGQAPEAEPPAWEVFRQSWNTRAAAGNRKEWKLPAPPDGWEARIAEPGWYDQALEAIARLPKCRFFDSPVPLSQFVRQKFVPLCLGGQYDSPKAGKGSAATTDAKASAEELAARFQARDPDKARQLAEFIEAKRRRQGA